MKRILYISFHDLLNSKDGVSKKINNQVKSFKKMNLETSVIFRTSDSIYFNSLSEKICERQNTGRRDIHYVYKWLLSSEKFFDYIYIRYEGTNVSKIKYLKKMKLKGSKIVLEIPTYPYKGEYKSWKRKIGYFIKEIINLELKKYVDFIITFSEDNEIMGIPCINISNGIDLNQIRVVNKKEKNNNNLVFTSVSTCANWHGIDRFLNSLIQLESIDLKPRIHFNIVGEGVETERLKEIVNGSSYLKKSVVFCGFKSGKDLDEIYDSTDICVGSLARHRSGVENLKTLKNREYAAKGLPIIYSEIDSDFEGQDFIYKVKPDETLIDLQKIIKWYYSLEIKPQEIREYAKQFSWDIQMKKVINVMERV